MDRVIEKKKFSLVKIGLPAGLILLISAVIYFILQNSGSSRLNIDTGRILISEIKKGAFKETIPVNGIVLPISTIYLDALEGGRVEEILVEDGAIMKKDQAILRLSNTDLELSLANQETAVFQVLTQMQNTKNIAEQNSINRLNQMADVDNALVEAERIFKLNQRLYEEGVISRQEFESTQNLYNYQVKRKKLAEDILKQDAGSMSQQVSQATESYARMQNTLQLMRRKVGDLIVRAPIGGQLTSLDAEIGQSKNKGERLGQIDITTGFKVRADIDEHYISRIYTGLKGEFSIAGKVYQLVIKKVYTQVANGRFQVDMEFEGNIPEGIRRGQSLQIRMALSEETQALLLPRGGFFQETGGNWIFKLNDKGTIARKVDIRLGRQSPEYYELLEGLQVGDKVITSGYDNFGDNEELVLKGG
jgi:HlyD family secretion protein